MVRTMGDKNRFSDDVVTFRYKFVFKDRNEKDFIINLDALTLDKIPSEKKNSLPFWTKLNFCQCNNCPLDEKKNDFCPIAYNFIDLFDFFTSLDSFNETTVLIESPERSYSQTTTVQSGLGSLLGIYMVTSGCPRMEVLKPMVRFHLPFASLEETVFRSVSTYLLGQYFSMKQGKPADFGLEKLKDFYLEIQQVNIGIAKRMRSVTAKDAFANAIISLDAFAKEMAWSIEDDLENLKYLYSGYLK